MALALLAASPRAAAEDALAPELGAGSLPQPGQVIDAHSVKRYRDLLPEHVVRLVREGTWLDAEEQRTIEVGPSRPAPLPASYREATRRHAGETSLAPDGSLRGWTAGLPFPDPEPPQLGAKILWNQYYRWRGDDAVIDTYRTVQTDARGNQRETRGVFELLGYAGRTDRPPFPELPSNGAGIRTASRLIFLHPTASKWTTTLTYRFKDPTRDDESWIYLPTTRRVLRVQSGQRCAPVRGSTFTPDDFFGFDGRVWEHRWELVADGHTLAVMHQQHLPTRLDRSGTWPTHETWELREVWVVDGTPKDSGYCYGRRRLWIDKETFQVLHAEVWDRNGDYWKGFQSTYAHRPVGTEEMAPIWGGTAGYDFQTLYVTYVTIGESEMGLGYRIDGSDLRRTDFTPNALLRLGR